MIKCYKCDTIVEGADMSYCTNCGKQLKIYGGDFVIPNIGRKPGMTDDEIETVLRFTPKTEKFEQGPSFTSEARPLDPTFSSWISGTVAGMAVAFMALFLITAVGILLFRDQLFGSAKTVPPPIANNANAIGARNEPPKTPQQKRTPRPIESPTPLPVNTPDLSRTEIKQQIINSQFPVGPRSFRQFAISADQPGTISGGFRAYGGSNDINVIVVDPSGLDDLSNGRRYRQYYETGYTERGRPSVHIPAGTYYVVFDNRQAWLTSKSVAAELYFQTDQ